MSSLAVAVDVNQAAVADVNQAAWARPVWDELGRGTLVVGYTDGTKSNFPFQKSNMVNVKAFKYRLGLSKSGQHEHRMSHPLSALDVATSNDIFLMSTWSLPGNLGYQRCPGRTTAEKWFHIYRKSRCGPSAPH